MEYILIAESESKLRENMAEYFMNVGYGTYSAENGLEALEIFKAMGPSYWRALVTDFEMPYLNGGELIIEIRNLLASNPLSIVLTSSKSHNSPEIKRLLEKYPVTVVQKPYIMLNLVKKIQEDDVNFGRVIIEN